MSGGLFLLALLPIFVTCDPSFDFRSVKYAERNGKCFVDVYQPSLQESEPLTNFFIRQTFKSECYPSFTKHGFNLIHNNKGGYHFVGCFYYNESQTIKCEEFNDNEFKQVLENSCNKPAMKETNEFLVYMEKYNHQSFVTVYVMSNKGSMVTDPETKGCGRYEYVDEEFSQFNALKNKYFYRSKGEKKTFEDFSSFGDVTIYKFDGSKKILIKDENGKELNTEWKADYDYTFDNNQARGKVELPFSKNYFGIKFVEEKNGKCFVGFSDLMTGEGKKRVGIPCNAPDTIGSYGIVQDSDGNYRLRACFLDYKNVVPFLRCFVKKDESFIQEFSHQFQKCDFTLYDIDDDEIHFRQRFRLLPNIIIGPLQGTSSKLNGILIDFAEKSCKLDVKDGKITNETVVEPDEFGRGFDSIRDDFLVRSKLPFDFKSMKEILSKHSPIMSTGSNVFFKGRGNKWIVVDPTGTRAEYSGDYESVVDDSFLKLI